MRHLRHSLVVTHTTHILAKQRCFEDGLVCLLACLLSKQHKLRIIHFAGFVQIMCKNPLILCVPFHVQQQQLNGGGVILSILDSRLQVGNDCIAQKP